MTTQKYVDVGGFSFKLKKDIDEQEFCKLVAEYLIKGNICVREDCDSEDENDFYSDNKNCIIDKSLDFNHIKNCLDLSAFDEEDQNDFIEIFVDHISGYLKPNKCKYNWSTRRISGDLYLDMIHPHHSIYNNYRVLRIWEGQNFLIGR